jgi:hypothetical protein
MNSRKVSRGTKGLGRPGKPTARIPIGIPPLLRRFWNYAKNMAKKFSKNLNDSEEKEEEFLKVIRRDFDKWS